MNLMYNGAVLAEADFHVSKNNRAFRYGDGLFESMKYSNGKLHFIEDHYFRLMGSMRFMRMEIPMDWTPEYLEEQVLKTITANGLEDEAVRVRFVVFRSGEGKYMPSSNQPNWLIETEKVENQLYELNKEGLQVDVFQYHHKPSGLLSNMKTLSCSIYILASIFARENELSDALLLNENGLLLEATSANIFLVQNGKIKTPKHENGCLKGVMRKVMLDNLVNWGYEVEELELRPFDLVKSDEVFLTNASQGIRWVSQYKKKSFGNVACADIAQKLNELIS